MTDITRTLNDEGIASPKGKLWGKTSVDAILINEAYTNLGKRDRKVPSDVLMIYP